MLAVAAALAYVPASAVSIARSEPEHPAAPREGVLGEGELEVVCERRGVAESLLERGVVIPLVLECSLHVGLLGLREPLRGQGACVEGLREQLAGRQQPHRCEIAFRRLRGSLRTCGSSCAEPRASGDERGATSQPEPDEP